MFSQFAQNTDWYYIVGQIFRTHCNHTSSCFQTVIFDVCFQEPGESMLTPFSLHSKKKEKKKTSTTYSDHTVPSCPRQTNPGSPFPRTDFLEMCCKKMKCVWCSIEKHRVCLSRVFKDSGTVSLTLFVFPLFLVRSVTHFHAHPWKSATFSMCTNSNYTHKCTHTHACAQIQTNTTLRVVISITSKHLQCD